jgi:thiamine monophosphate synthase
MIKKLNYYIFIDELNIRINNNIIRLKKQKKKIFIIVRDVFLNEVLKFSRKNQIPIFVVDNLTLAIKNKVYGIFLTSMNKILKNNIQETTKLNVIGLAHNQMEYFIKNRQNCSMVMLSPIFYNTKYSNNKILKPIRYNLISLGWKKEVCALGGINQQNIKLVNLTKSNSIGIKSLITK